MEGRQNGAENMIRELLKAQTPYFEFLEKMSNYIGTNYIGKMRQFSIEHNLKVSDYNALFLNIDKIVFYIGKNFIAVEYIGNPFADRISEDSSVLTEVYDYSDSERSDFIAQIIGIDKSRYNSIPLVIDGVDCENLFLPTSDALQKMLDLGWNVFAEESIFGINAGYLDLTPGKFHRLKNCRFFDQVNGSLKTRIAQWIDFFPSELTQGECEDEDENVFNLKVKFPSFYNDLWKEDLLYSLPISKDFKYKKLPQLNRFIEIIADNEKSETDITGFLAESENEFIITMGFGCVSAKAQLKGVWQGEDKQDIIPDFYIIRANGYADIVEFKLPRIKGEAVVGKTNRETFSAELNSYISQTRVYASFFENPQNRKWMQNQYGFTACHPKRILVVGRRSDFATNQWMDIKSDYQDVDIITYDDLVDTVMAQFYL